MAERGECVVGIDLGSTTVKAVAFDATGRPIGSSDETLQTWHHASGAAEQDPSAVARAALGALAAAAHTARGSGYSIARVGLSAAMHSLIPVDADGAPLARAMLWMDQRPAQVARALWASPRGKDLYTRTGAPIHAMTPLAKLLWLRAEQPALFARAARFVSLKEWLWHEWFNVWEIDPGIAGATGLYNLRTHDWDAEALALAGITTDRLSTLVPATMTRHGPRDTDLAQYIGPGDAVAYTIGSSDGVLANLGVGAITPGDLVLTIGTSLAVRAGSADPQTDEATRMFCYPLDQSHYVVGGPSNSGGVVLDWLYHHVLRGPDGAAPATERMPSDFAALLDAARTIRDPALLCLPYVAGERAPLWDADATATFHGLRVIHTSAHLLRAAVEGIIFNARWIAEPLLSAAQPPRRLIATGKVLETTWIRQLVADVFSLPAISFGAVDASVLGAATLANLAAGTWTWDDVAARRHLPEAATLQPSAAEDYRAPYARFRQVCAALRDLEA